MPTPVKAEIVIAQVGNPAPGGYVSGGRDNIDVGALITLTNRNNAGVTGWRWKITPCAAVPIASYGVTGDESATCQLTPPDPYGYGDFAVELTVFGDPLPGVPSNRSTTLVIVGVRVPIDAYPDGMPVPSELETGAGGSATLSQAGGRERRLQEALYALAKLLQASGGGGTATRLRADANAFLSGDTTLASGAGIALTQLGSTITFVVAGTTIPSPFTATLVSGNLRITAPSSATPKSIDIFGQDSSGAGSGDVRLAGGDGTTKGLVRFGYISAGNFNETLSWNQATLQLAGQFKLSNRLLSVSGGIASTPWDFKHDFSATTFATALAATLPAYRLQYVFSDKTVTALTVGYDRVTTEGMIDISLPSGSTLPVVRLGRTDSGGVRKVWSELFELEQTTTLGTLVVFGSIPIPINSVYKITVDSVSRAGSAGGTHCAKRIIAQRAASGAPVFVTTSTTLSTTGEQATTDLDFAINGNSVDIACKGVAATSMDWRHRVEVFYGP